MRKTDFNNIEELVKWLKIINMVDSLLMEGYGPAADSDKIFNAVPGKVEDDDIYYAVIVDENGKPVDWYGYAFNRPDFASGFGGWHKESYTDLIEECPWIKDVMKEIA